MTHANAPLNSEGRRRLVERCRTRPVSHVAAEAGVSRACLSKWKNRYDTHGEVRLQHRSSVPRSSPTQTPPDVVERIEHLRRNNKWSARRITLELANQGVRISERTVGRWPARLGIHHRRFPDPDGSANRRPSKWIVARYPGHMVHLDVKKLGQIPDGGGWRAHGRGSEQAGAAQRAKTGGAKGGYVYLHSAGDGFSRLAYTEPLPDEKAATTVTFLSKQNGLGRSRSGTSTTTTTGLTPPPETVLQLHASTRASPTSCPATPRACRREQARQRRARGGQA